MRQSQLYWLRICQDILEKNHKEKNWILGVEVSDASILFILIVFGLAGEMPFDKTKGFAIDQQDPMVFYQMENGGLDDRLR